MANPTKKLAEKESPPDLPGGCTARQSLAEVVGGMHRRTDELYARVGNRTRQV
jgi:hypothetical protein